MKEGGARSAGAPFRTHLPWGRVPHLATSPAHSSHLIHEGPPYVARPAYYFHFYSYRTDQERLLHGEHLDLKEKFNKHKDVFSERGPRRKLPNHPLLSGLLIISYFPSQKSTFVVDGESVSEMAITQNGNGSILGALAGSNGVSSSDNLQGKTAIVTGSSR